MGSSRCLCWGLVLTTFLLHLLNVCAGKVAEESADHQNNHYQYQQTQTAAESQDEPQGRELWGASNSDMPPTRDVHFPPRWTVPVIHPLTPTTMARDVYTSPVTSTIPIVHPLNTQTAVTRDMYSPPVSTVPIINPTTSPTTFPTGNPTTNNPPTYMTPVVGTAPAGDAIPAAAGGGGGGGGGKSWCVASPSASPTALQVGLDYACGFGGADCSAIQQGGSCFNPDTIKDHASYAYNSYYQKNPVSTSCDFGGTATVTTTDPSTPGCMYPSSSPSSGTTIGGGGGGGGGGGAGVIGGGGAGTTASPSFPSAGGGTPVSPAGIYGSTGSAGVSSSFGDSTASMASSRFTPRSVQMALLLPLLLSSWFTQH